MVVTAHQQLHLDAIKVDAEGIQDQTEKTRVLDEVAVAEITWIHAELLESEVHDYIEKLDWRSFWDSELASR